MGIGRKFVEQQKKKMTPDMDVDGLVKDLLEVKNLPEFAKLRTKDGVLSIDKWHLTQGIWRWYEGETRQDTVFKLQKTYSLAQETLENLSEHTAVTAICAKKTLVWEEFKAFKTRKNDIDRIYNTMRDSLPGLQRLAETYHKEVADLTILQDKVDVFLKEFKKVLEELHVAEEGVKVKGKTEEVSRVDLEM